MSLRLDEPFRWGGLSKVNTQTAIIPHEGMAVAVKAATGWQPFYNASTVTMREWNQTPSKVMRQAQALYWTSPWIGVAERTVTRKVAGLPWHIEDENDDEVDDQTANPQLQAIRDLLEKPQSALPLNMRQPGVQTRRGLVSIISRHMGLCGIAYVHPDSPDKNGIPLALLYVNPARVTPKSTESGTLIGYAVDADDYGNGGTPFRPEQLIPFYLEVPDWGTDTIGFVGAAAQMARITSAASFHALNVLTTGGRIAGLVSPKDGYIDDGERFAQLEADFRNVNEDPNAARRMTIVRGPLDFNKTAADPQELGLVDLINLERDDTLAVWGVPPSQAGVSVSRGMNSGEQGKHEHEVLMTGPVHDRVVVIQETFQYELLDRWQTVNLDPQLVIEEPEFDDEGPAYEIASKARELPLTNNERREIIGHDPLPDYGPDGEPLGLAIVLPATLSAWAQGPEEDGQFGNAPQKPEPPPPPPVIMPPQLPPPNGGTEATPAPVPPVPPAKATGSVLGLKDMVDRRMLPAAEKAVEKVLREQREDVAKRLANATPRQLKDESYWWRGEYWDHRLEKALKPFLVGIAGEVAEQAQEHLS